MYNLRLCPLSEDKRGSASKVPKSLRMSYICMKRRCYQKSSDQWEYYGARGIKICQEWLNDFGAFVAWAMESGWHEGLTIDRIDPNGDYKPSNCRWADRKIQMNNVRRNIRLLYENKRMTLAQFCDMTGADYDRARYLIFKRHLSPEDAIKEMNLSHSS